MDKLKMHTVDRAEENFKKLCELFPNAVTETKNENGEVVRAIDADVLRQEISGEVVEGSQERYQFTWPDKKKSVVLANQPIAKTLRLEREKSVGRDGTAGSIDTENIYIEGDNLDALKLLQETYLGKVKMIYIDPPYNTGNDFVYEDDFSQDKDEYITGSGQLDEQGRQLVQNPESNGRFHTDWLNMLYPRLRIARDLLSDDGVIFISIDINEQHNLRKICDEIFGDSNIISDIIWNSRKSVSNDAVVSLNHNYTLIYAKNMIVFYQNKFKFKLPDTGDGFENPDNDPRGLWKADPFDSPGIRPNLTYPIVNPNTGVEYLPPEGRCWRTGQKEYLALLEDNRIVFGKSGNSKPQMKRFYSEAQQKGITPKSLWDDCGTATDGTKEIIDLFGSKVFDTPKPTSLIFKILQLASDKDCTVMDFFSGSATTAQAVMLLNAKDNGNRKYIMVQLPEKIDTEREAYKLGYKTICDIGEERIRRAGKKIKETLLSSDNSRIQEMLNPKKKEDSDPNRIYSLRITKIYTYEEHEKEERERKEKYKKIADNLDIGFRVFRVDSSNMQNVYYAPADFKQEQLELLADNIKPDRTPEDLLFQVMLDLGITLSSKIDETHIDGKKVFSVADGYMIACFDNDITEQTVTEIAKKQPFYAVFRDSGMASDSVMTNFEQIFETYSPKTVRRVL